MKIKITESDIKKMVSKSVVNALCESMDALSVGELINGDGVMSQDVLPAFVEIYGDEARNAISTARGNYNEIISNFINNGTPEQEEAFRQRVTGDGWDVPDDMMYAINECVNRVVDRKLREYDK